MDFFNYFPSTIYREEHPEWVEHTLKACEKHFGWTQRHYVDQTGKPVDIQSGGLSKTFPVLQTGHMAQDPELAFLAEYFQAAGVEILRRQGYDMSKYEFYVSGMWGQDIKCYGGHSPHVHKHSQLSGFFFIETPAGGSYPIFLDPRQGKAMIELDILPSEEVTEACNAVHFNNIKPGTLMLFNSWLPHQLTMNESNTPSKFIHFILAHKDKAQQCSM